MDKKIDDLDKKFMDKLFDIRDSIVKVLNKDKNLSELEINNLNERLDNVEKLLSITIHKRYDNLDDKKNNGHKE